MNRNMRASFRIALRALRVNKMRSALTMLGIVIGVGAVIAMVAIGAGATSSIQSQIASIGSNLIIVMPGSVTSGGMRMGNGQASTLTQEDAVAISASCPAVSAVSPISRGGGQVVAGNNNWGTQIQGVMPDYLTIRDLKISEGRSFSMQDVDSANKVVLLGQTVVDNLFGADDPVGQPVRINKTPFTVLGVLSPKGQSAQGQDQDDVILMPISTAKKKVLGANQANSQAVQQIMVQARDAAQIAGAIDQVTELLRQRHRIQANQDDDFNVRNLQEVFQALESSANVTSLLLAAIASISLLVGGIGIMNTMLISVTERTREIGLRQAVGAKTGDIRTQFLVESVVLSVLGGSFGIGLGCFAAWAISHFAHWTTMIYPGAIVLAFGFSALVGIFFGFYPARKASLLDPIVALRYE